MEYLKFAEQHNRYARSFPFLDLRAEGFQKRFDIMPSNVGRDRMRKDGGEYLSMPAFHVLSLSARGLLETQSGQVGAGFAPLNINPDGSMFPIPMSVLGFVPCPPTYALQPPAASETTTNSPMLPVPILRPLAITNQKKFRPDIF